MMRERAVRRTRNREIWLTARRLDRAIRAAGIYPAGVVGDAETHDIAAGARVGVLSDAARSGCSVTEIPAVAPDDMAGLSCRRRPIELHRQGHRSAGWARAADRERA